MLYDSYYFLGTVILLTYYAEDDHIEDKCRKQPDSFIQKEITGAQLRPPLV